MSTTKSYLLTAAATVTVLLGGYAVYFDYKRRNDASFRRKLRQEKKKAHQFNEERAAERRRQQAEQTAKAGAAAAAGGGLGGAAGLGGGADIGVDDPVPAGQEERGEYFLKQLQQGETLLARGPSAYTEAASHFFAALRIYPEPMNLLMVFQQSLPQPVLELIMEKMAADVRSSEENYNTFPTNTQNVKVIEVKQTVNEAGKKIVRRGLVVQKDYNEGEEIYREDAVVGVVDSGLEDQTCQSCLSPLTAIATTLTTCTDCPSSFCSPSCLETASVQWHSLLCSGKSETGELVIELKQHCEEAKSTVAWGVAMFLAKMVWEEGVEAGEKGEWSTWDHLERLYDLKKASTEVEEKEAGLIRRIIAPSVPGFEEFLTTARYIQIKNKFLYNSYGVTLPLTSSPSNTAAPTTTTPRRTHTPSPNATILTLLTSYISHSCEPNVTVEYVSDYKKEGKAEVKVVAKKELKEGDEIFVSYVEAGERGVKERRKELKSKYAFHCKCTRCLAESEKGGTA
ncbi:hypothetical protein HK097_009771 [Rhizophlyctis rosea]|uniref:SET domain-containing protein n=1 Tax=Rhizophlyctis rosea TaxID=64517 RepID=A0AAD5X496_9FUNG|nr:hypothetical protein HK097_009771 [Rhizophlyctis rosea]